MDLIWSISYVVGALALMIWMLKGGAERVEGTWFGSLLVITGRKTGWNADSFKLYGIGLFILSLIYFGYEALG